MCYEEIYILVFPLGKILNVGKLKKYDWLGMAVDKTSQFLLNKKVVYFSWFLMY